MSKIDTRDYWDAFWASTAAEDRAKAVAAEEELRRLQEKLVAADRRLQDMQRSADEYDEQVPLSHAIDQIRAIIE